MKNILLIIPYGGVGGMERLALTFYNHYKQKGYNVKGLKLIKLENDIINFNEDELFLKPYDFSVMSKIERALFYLKAPLMIRKIIKKEKITHSIAFGDMPNILSSLTKTKDFKVGSIHALKSIELSNPKLMNKVFSFCYKTSYKNLDKVVCISKAIKEDLISKCGYKFDNLEIIYNPHDLKEIEKKSIIPIENETEKLIFSDKIILFLGRLSYQKSPWHLIKSFYLIQDRVNDAKLVLIGDGMPDVIDHVNYLIDKFKLKEKVIFLGRKENPYKYLVKSKLLALSSHYEGTPNVIVESMSLGVPVVSSNCTDGILELMTEKKIKISDKNVELESGIITPNLYKGTLKIPENNDFIQEEYDFANALVAVLKNNKYKNSLLENQKSLLDKFDVNIVSKKYLTPIV